MTLSRREQILLAALIIVGLLAIGNYLIFQPMNNDYNALKTQEMDLQAQYDQAILELAQLDKKTAEVGELQRQIDSKTVRYFPSIIQEQLVLMTNQLYNDSEIQVQSETFTMGVGHEGPRAAARAQAEENPAPDLQTISSDYNLLMTGTASQPAEQPAETAEPSEEEQKAAAAAIASIESMGLNVQFTANYPQAIEFVRQVEALNRSIQVQNLFMSVSDATEQTTTGPNGEIITIAAPQGLLDCTIDLVFNAIPKLSSQDDDYEAWTLTDDYGKDDPFATQED